MSPDAVMKHGKDFGRNLLYRCFQFNEWKSNERVVVTRNADHWDGQAGVDAVIFRPLTDGNTRVAEMLAGGIDLMVEVPPTSLSEFSGSEFSVVEQAGPHVWFLILNAKEGPFGQESPSSG